MRQRLVSWMGASHAIRGSGVSALSPLCFRKKRGAGNWVSDWSYLQDEASVKKKIPKVQCVEIFWVSEHDYMLGGGGTQLNGDKDSWVWHSLDLMLCITLAVHLDSLSSPIIVHVSISLSSVSCSNKLSNLRREPWEPWFIASCQLEVAWTTWHLRLPSKVGQSCGIEPLGCGICC